MADQRRVLDYVFFLYFLVQIPSTLLFDSQGVYSEWLYPGWLKSVRNAYMGHYRDPFLANAWNHPWYLSVCLVEHFIEMPFFVWATLVYFRGAKTSPSILLPAIAYSIHTITAILAVWMMALFADFSQSQALAPRTFGERLTLCSAYAPFIIVSSLCLWDSVVLCWERMNIPKRD